MARQKSSTGTAPSRRSQRLIRQAKLEEEQKLQSSKPKRSRRPRQRKSCRLLALPGELRNSIYELALLQTGRVHITSTGPGQPSLLSTCRQIRREAGTIYYTKNEFSLRIEAYNGAEFVPFARQARKFICIAQAGNINFYFNSTRNWDNVVAWIKAQHMDNALVPDWSEPMTKDDHVVFGAFKIANDVALWGWQRKEEALKVLYDTLRGTCSPWVKYEDHVCF